MLNLKHDQGFVDSDCASFAHFVKLCFVAVNCPLTAPYGLLIVFDLS